MTTPETSTLPLTTHHVGIQTQDLANSVSWYQDFMGCVPSWSLDTFSELTRDRLPGIRRLTEVALGDLRIHLFERPGDPAPDPAESRTQFQHVCLSVRDADDLVTLRRRWIELFDSGRYTYAVPAGPTEVVEDADGIRSFYAYDVNGLEFEFTWVPAR